MFKLPNPPSSEADECELADFVELLSWEKGAASKREVVAHLGRGDDNAHNAGCDDDDDAHSEFLDEVMVEVERRSAACGSGYPFRLDLKGTVLRHRTDDNGEKALLYRYLLLCTRINMKDSRIHAGIDGADLLEEVAAKALQNYLGPARAKSMVFGTAAAGNFEQKIDTLCTALREGGSFRSLDNARVDANDDKLDAVAWVPFTDGRPGQVILFGQCKTGSTWEGHITQLQPDAFIKKWMRDPVLVNPVRAFCVSDAPLHSRWKGLCANAGIMLDRCRLVDFGDCLDAGLFERIRKWTDAARTSITCPRGSRRR